MVEIPFLPIEMTRSGPLSSERISVAQRSSNGVVMPSDLHHGGKFGYTVGNLKFFKMVWILGIFTQHRCFLEVLQSLNPTSARSEVNSRRKPWPLDLSTLFGDYNISSFQSGKQQLKVPSRLHPQWWLQDSGDWLYSFEVKQLKHRWKSKGTN